MSHSKYTLHAVNQTADREKQKMFVTHHTNA